MTLHGHIYKLKELHPQIATISFNLDNNQVHIVDYISMKCEYRQCNIDQPKWLSKDDFERRSETYKILHSLEEELAGNNPTEISYGG